MIQDPLARFFEHNNWANQTMLDVCLGLADEQLDAAPDPLTPWSVRHTLTHIVEAQLGYWCC